MSEFFNIRLEIDPPTVTHHDKQLGKGEGGKTVMFDDPRLKAARDAIIAGLQQVVRCRPPAPIDVAIRMDVTFCFRSALVGWHLGKPDRDNLLKTFQDCLVTHKWIKRDELVVTGDVTKLDGPKPYIHAVAVPADPRDAVKYYEEIRKPKEA